MSKNSYVRAGLPALFCCLMLLTSATAAADELMKWERIPLQIPLKVGTERVVFVDKNVRVGFPPALNGKLRVQSTGGAVYLKAEGAFPQTRIQLQDVESGEIILFDLTAGDKGPTEAVRLVYSGDVSTLSDANNVQDQGKGKGTSADGSPPSDAPGSDNGTQATRRKIRYDAPVPVLLTRYAAQSLYAPVRTVEALPGVHPVNPHLPRHLTTLYPSAPLAVTPLAAWGAADRSVVALRLRNTGSQKVVLDPRALQGQFVAATFQHRWVGPVGTPEDTTTVYLVTSGRPESAFLAEPARHAKEESRHAD
ncbi:TIGR03749 family integrating conjugative element protein [Erwinia tracheiphila]|uniref:TIGR03749 family integrating conjugative element protein n=1 Tax=Erwinia tracheiphila TaxID=65700 RepID=A0A345CU06_9GAMM|nr:TIGR03749 family integrating conjugative element protein [Erwinia tracheiphila]AXF76923.1 TIGR03749 family integrating conjugative element protein [Erwinia tracheiphila]UIA84400.1 TIGR03749 family integrating conjugative element protein [Erwinia tracheiphila]UIA92980.1 TIGR03749 family integrating conjugative element protein [Erwinia tracheiphila]